MDEFPSNLDLDFPEDNRMQVSYFRARDKSILACNVVSHDNVCTSTKILENEALDTPATETESSGKDDGHLHVYLRIKKSNDFQNLYEVSDNTLICKVPDGAQCIRNFREGTSMMRTFKFSKIFGAHTTQTDLFNCAVKVKLLQFINGYHCTLLTYGASGSGKTFTIIGTAEQPGIVPRALEYLFRTLPQLPDQPSVKPLGSGGIARLKETDSKLAKSALQNLLQKFAADRLQHTQTYKAMQQRLSSEPVAVITDDLSSVSLGIWVTFAEIYNEYIYDLLAPEPPRGQTRQKLRLGNFRGKTYIKDLKHIYVSSGLEAYYVLQYGLHNLKYAATSLNDHSSRSHSIFTIKLVQASDAKDGYSISSFNFCDLAGSERVKKTHNIGDRLRESNNINTSLLVLGRCITLVRETQKTNVNKPIPFRESKLTQLFQKALMGQEAISMIVNINPVREMFDESQHVLNFSAIAKDVTVEQQQLVKRLKKNRFTQYMAKRNPEISIITEEPDEELQELQAQVAMLHDELVQQKLNFENEKQDIVSGYKKLMGDRRAAWEKECQRLEGLLTENMRKNVRESIQSGKKRRRSVVVISSSSDEEDEAMAEGNCKCCRKKICAPTCELEVSRCEIAEAKLKLQARQSEVEVLRAKVDELASTAEDARKSYLDLQHQYLSENNDLVSRILQQQEQINEQKAYIEALNRNASAISDIQQGIVKETSCSLEFSDFDSHCCNLPLESAKMVRISETSACLETDAQNFGLQELWNDNVLS